MDEQIKEQLEKLRGMLQADGGDLELIAIEGKTVKVTLKGACGCCPHAQQTLKEGVENVLRSEVVAEVGECSEGLDVETTYLQGHSPPIIRSTTSSMASVAN